LAGILKVNDENSRIRIRIKIQIHFVQRHPTTYLRHNPPLYYATPQHLAALRHTLAISYLRHTLPLPYALMNVRPWAALGKPG